MPEPWDPVPGDPGELTDQDYLADFQIEKENPLVDLLVESEKHRKVAADILWEEVENQNRLAEEGLSLEESQLPLSEAMRQVGLEFLEGFKQGVENAQLKFEDVEDGIQGARSHGSIFDEAVDWNDVKNPKLSDKDKDLHRKKVLKKETNRRANKLARTNRKKNRKK